VVIPAPVVVELDWLVRSRLGGAVFDAFLADVESGAFESRNFTRGTILEFETFASSTTIWGSVL
jgi:hypothetical protein